MRLLELQTTNMGAHISISVSSQAAAQIAKADSSSRDCVHQQPLLLRASHHSGLPEHSGAHYRALSATGVAG